MAAAASGSENDIRSLLEKLKGRFGLDAAVNRANREVVHDLLSLEGEKLIYLHRTYAVVKIQ